MADQPPHGGAVILDLSGEYSPPDGDAVIAGPASEPPYSAPSGRAVRIDLSGEYTPPSGAAIILDLSPSEGGGSELQPPAEPVITLVSTAPGRLVFAWSAASAAPITEWAVELYQGDTLIESLATTTTEHSSTNLDEVTEYRIEVTATSFVGSSPTATLTARTSATPPFRGPAPMIGIRYAIQPQITARSVGHPWHGPPLASARCDLVYRRAQAVRRQAAIAWALMQPTRAGAGVPWSDTQPTPTSLTAPWRSLLRRRPLSDLPWSDTEPLPAATRIKHHGPPPKRVATLLPWGKTEQTSRIVWVFHHGPPPKHRGSWMPWFDALPLDWFIRPPLPPDPDPPGPDPSCYQPPRGDAVVLDLSGEYSPPPGDAVVLDLACPGAVPVIVIPSKEVYLVQNSASLIRVSDQQPLAAYDLRVSIDADSWGWTFDASLPGDMWAEVQPATGGPVTVEAVINGHRFRALVETVQRSRRFGETSVTISGRGIAAELAAPLAPVQQYSHSADRTAQQLIDEVLLNTGWSVNWKVTDWLIPAGTWSHAGTPISAISDIAEAIDAVVQADPVDRVLHILPRYPVAPWHWPGETPDVEMPLEPVITDRIEQRDQPEYNRVYVTGTSGAGRIGQVTRDGTTGDLVAPTVSHPLITDPDASRQRAMAVLGNTGRQWLVGLNAPVSSEIALLSVGQLIAVDPAGDGLRGIVRALRLSSSSDASGALIVRQSADVEVHE